MLENRRAELDSDYAKILKRKGCKRIKKIGKVEGVNFKSNECFECKKIALQNTANKWCIIDGIKFQSIKEGVYYQYPKVKTTK